MQEASFDHGQKHDPQELLHKDSLMIVEIKDCQQAGHFASIFNEIEHPFIVMVSVLSVLIVLRMIIIQENSTLHCQSGDTCTVKDYVNCCFNMEMHCASKTIQELFNRDEKHPADQFSRTNIINQDWKHQRKSDVMSNYVVYHQRKDHQQHHYHQVHYINNTIIIIIFPKINEVIIHEYFVIIQHIHLVDNVFITTFDPHVRILM